MYPALLEAGAEERLPLECCLAPSDVLYVPKGWYHMTLTLSPYAVSLTLFTPDDTD